MQFYDAGFAMWHSSQNKPFGLLYDGYFCRFHFLCRVSNEGTVHHLYYWKNWISLLSEYKLNPYDELQFGLTNTPQLVLLAFKRNEEKDWITVTEPSQVRKLTIADQTRSPLSRTSVPPSATDRAPTVALALTAAAAQSDLAKDWAPTEGVLD